MITRRLGLVIGANQEVAETLEQLRRSVRPKERIVLHVALMPPLAQVRRVELPPMPEDDARRAIARNVARYFPDVREVQVVAVRRVDKSWLAASAPVALVTAIHEGARALGWEVGGVVPAHAAWAAMGAGLLTIKLDREALVLDAVRGQLTGVRRLRERAHLPQELARARELARTAEEAGSMAALHAPRVRGLEFVPDSVRALRAGMVRRAAWSLAAVSAAMLLIAAGLALWGEHRELDAIRAHRAKVRAQVLAALSSRDSLVEMQERLGTIAALEQSSARWSAVIARVAGALPGDASLTAFRAEADSVSLEGQARDAAGVFAAMRSAPGFLAVRAAAPVRQEGGGATGQLLVERFTMAARLNAGASP